MIELPMDAEGREIPLDTKCLYTCGGEKQDVLGFPYYLKEEKWEIETDSLIVNSIYLYIKPPDSWEKLEEDLDKCVAEGTACTYFSKDGTCQSCSPSNITTGCSPKVIEDIVSRIRKLRGEA